MSYQLKVKISRRAFRFPLLDPVVLSALDLKDDEKVVVQSKKGRIIAPDVYNLDSKDNKGYIGLDDDDIGVLDVATGDLVSISKIKVADAKWIVLKPIEEPMAGLAERASRLLRVPLNRIPVFQGQTLTLRLRYDRFQLVVAGFHPIEEVVVITSDTEVLIANESPRVEYSVQDIVKKDIEKRFVILKLTLTFIDSSQSLEFQRAVEDNEDMFAIMDKCKRTVVDAIKIVNDKISKAFAESDKLESPDLGKIKKEILNEWNKE